MNKAIIATLLVSLAAIGGVSYMAGKTQLRGTEPNMQDAWAKWKAAHPQAYQVAEDIYRFLVFLENYAHIQKHNMDTTSSYKLGLNQFSAMTNDEFKAQNQGTLMAKTSYNPVEIAVTTRPTSVNWQTAGAVTPIKNQGQCGSCWAFSTTGSLEGLNFITNKNLLSFSEQQLVDCSGSFGNMGCNGGLMDYAFQYVEANGITLESTYPYTAETDTCVYKSSESKFKITGYTDVTANSTDQLLNAAAQQPISVAIEADSADFQSYSSGVFDDASCGTALDHGVLVYGYGTASGKQFYWLKNSWGTTWGQNGVMQIAVQTGPGICGIQMQPSYPTV